MKNVLKITAWTVLLLMLVVILTVLFCGGPLIKAAVNTAGPRVLGVPVSLHEAHLAPFRGKLSLKGLHVGNPEGFKTDGLFELGLLDIDLDMVSLFKKVMVIREIRIEGPEITYERALKNSNIGALLDQLAPKESAAPADTSKPAPAPKAESGKKVVIQKLTISGARVHASITALGGHTMVLPLPPIALHNIGGAGKEAQGVTMVEAIRNILSAVLTSVTDVVTGAGKLAVDGVKAVGGVATDGVKAVGAGAGKALDGMKSLIGLGSKETKPATPAK